jgi:hypothetical protein
MRKAVTFNMNREKKNLMDKLIPEGSQRYKVKKFLS